MCTTVLSLLSPLGYNCCDKGLNWIAAICEICRGGNNTDQQLVGRQEQALYLAREVP